jgi:hypothetical protein
MLWMSQEKVKGNALCQKIIPNEAGNNTHQKAE